MQISDDFDKQVATRIDAMAKEVARPANQATEAEKSDFPEYRVPQSVA